MEDLPIYWRGSEQVIGRVSITDETVVALLKTKEMKKKTDIVEVYGASMTDSPREGTYYIGFEFQISRT